MNERGDKVEVVKKIEGMGGEMLVREVVDTREFFEKKGMNISDPRHAVIDEVIKFMEAVASQDYKKAEEAVEEIVKKGQSELFGEIGRVTRKLHNSMKELKDAIDPKFRDFAVIDVPSAVDKLQYVMERTEKAANKTMGLVEKYIMKMDDFSDNINGLNGPPERVQYLKDYKAEFSVDLAEMLVTQSFQDITGQSIKKVIKLVGDMEEELIKLITRFGIKVERGAAVEQTESERVSQEDVDDLLKELGF